MDETRRVELLQMLGLLNADPDPAFDRLTRIAAAVTRSEIAAVSFMDHESQWVRSRVGPVRQRLPLGETFCARALECRALFEVPDATLDERFRTHDIVTGPRAIRSYAGQPIAFEGVALGTLCVMDRAVRTLSPAQHAILADLAGMVEGLLELRHKQRLLGDERRRAVELADALRDSEARLADAQRVAGMGSWERDVQTGAISWSAGLFEIIGANPAQGPLGPCVLRERVLPEDLPRYDAAAARAVGEGLPTREEFRIVRPDGAIRWMNAVCEPVRDAAGRLSRIRGTVQDITARQEQRLALQHSEERYRRIVETAEEGIWTIDAARKTTFVNPKMARMLGYEPEEMIGRHLFEFMDERAREQAALKLERRARGISEQHDFRLQRRDGSDLWTAMSTSPILDERGAYAGSLAMVTDITERRRAETALRQSEARFRSLTALSADWFWELDADFRLKEVVAGESTTKRLGAPRHVGMRPWEAGEDRKGVDAEVWARHRAQLEAHEPFRDFEVKAAGTDGTPQFLSISGEPIFEEGRFAGYRGVGRNMTEQRTAQHAREQLEVQLRESQKMEAIGVLAGGIAHDFNNVVAGILGNVALALQDLPPGHPVADSLEQIRKAGLRGRGLVQQILAFARRQPREVENLELRPLVDECIGLLRATLPAGVQIESVVDPEPLHVLADATQVGQVLMNLCTNAWHALEGPTGRIEIGLRGVVLDAEAARRVSATLPAGRYACLTVHDNGRGMDEETRQRIFEPFFTTKPLGEGTGLGLAVAHGIVAAHGGAVAVDSEEGAGSTFRIYLPRVKGASPAERSMPLAAAHHGRGERVLYVDDDEVMVVMVERLLQRLGYDPVCHNDPAAAIAAVRAHPDDFDVAVTDLNMPGLSGLDVARELSRLRSDLPVIISSGNLPEQLQADARHAGVRALLHKQYTLEELGAVIHWVLAGGQRLGLEPLQAAGGRGG
jgi:PAS domain S-box-containing protein